jgi:UDP-3-O-[3-hydroxymyristoyl] glucosamine N-acyltransferase
MRRGVPLIGARHPLASISPSARVANHTIIGARAIIGVNARVAEHTIISAGCIVDHDGVIEEGAHLGPAVRLAGTVEIGARATLGIGVTVIPCRRVGPHAEVQAGSVVIRDVPEGQKVGGVPAYPVEHATSRFLVTKPTAAAAR